MGGHHLRRTRHTAVRDVHLLRHGRRRVETRDRRPLVLRPRPYDPRTRQRFDRADGAAPADDSNELHTHSLRLRSSTRWTRSRRASRSRLRDALLVEADEAGAVAGIVIAQPYRRVALIRKRVEPEGRGTVVGRRRSPLPFRP